MTLAKDPFRANVKLPPVMEEQGKNIPVLLPSNREEHYYQRKSVSVDGQQYEN